MVLSALCPELLPLEREVRDGELKEAAFNPWEFIAGKDARTLAGDLLALSQEEFSAAFRKSPMKHAKLAGLQRNVRMTLECADEA